MSSKNSLLIIETENIFTFRKYICDGVRKYICDGVRKYICDGVRKIIKSSKTLKTFLK